MNVKRLDLGADCVVLPQRDLLVLHPDLDYAESLGAIMGTLPDLHPDVAMALVEQVTPRPKVVEAPPRRTAGGMVAKVVVAVLAIGSFCGLVLPEQAAAGPTFGPDWAAAVKVLGMDCWGHEPDRRLCRLADGTPVNMRGYRHTRGSVYVSDGPAHRIIFVFETRAEADDYARQHPTVRQSGRAVMW